MIKITAGTKQDKLFEALRATFKGVDSIYCFLPLSKDGDVIMVAKDDLKDYNGNFFYQGDYSYLKMAAWIEYVSYAILEEVLTSKATLKKDAKMLSIPLLMFKDLNGFANDGYLTPDSGCTLEKTAGGELKFSTSYFGGGLKYYKNVAAEYETNKEISIEKLESPRRGYIVKAVETLKALYEGKEYAKEFTRECSFPLEEAPLSKEKEVYVIAADAESKKGVSRFKLSREGIVKKLATHSYTDEETVSMGFSLSADERRYEEDFKTTKFTRYEWGEELPVLTNDLPQEVLDNAEWARLQATINLEIGGGIDAYMANWEAGQWESAKKKAEEYAEKIRAN